MVIKISKVDVIGSSFILSPQFFPKKKDARVNTEHPPLRVLLLQKRRRRIRLFRDTHLVGRANQVCNGT